MADTGSSTDNNYEHDHRFRGKTIVIMGAGGNFGREGCLYFMKRGANVAALDLNAKALKETVALAEAESRTIDTTTTTNPTNNTILAIECNVTDVESVNAAVKTIVDSFQEIHLLWS